ncbi:glycosyltransferase involved in cell wall biosynthesis [Pontibacter ramchanderi]|uniref:Glycosyltransferase involved in cell wall biosynthesis n=2 Tax=Pontibacter ramchanderi TaxID=1179743 RepID=A0A2N3U7P4_9BACT|nr:glycosyltransferase involved in cell wall biosynthesis [Pontibacter ramchanderi]
MKVVHVVECFSGGTINFINLATKLIPDCQHIVVHGERPDEICPQKVKATFEQEVSFIKWTSVQREISVWKDFKALISLYNILKGIKADVIHLHSSKAGFLGRVVCKALGIKPVIYTPHGAAFLRKDIPAGKVRLFKLLEKIGANISGTVICCSESECRAFTDASIQASFINNGIAVGNRHIEFRKSPDSSLTIVNCGRVTVQKNPLLFNEIARAFEGNAGLRFIWVGEGELQHELESSNIEVTGWLPKQEVLALLRQADLYLSTSLWEGLPFAALEAMSLGKPMLLKDCVGNVDLVQDNYNGFLFSEADEAVQKIKLLQANREMLNEMGAKSIQLCIDRFNIQDTFQRYKEQYSKVSQLNVQ